MTELQEVSLFEPRGRGRWIPSLADLIDASGPCWLWQGRVEKTGYGRVYVGDTKWNVHRLIWTMLVGPIPPGLVIDHMCRVRACCNPDHLRVVTQRENNAAAPGSPSAMNIKKVECVNGHPYDEANTGVSVYPNGRRARYCRACHRDRYHARKRASA